MISSVDTAVREAQSGRSARFIGIAIASIAPAIFWCVVIELIAYWLGISLSPIAIGAMFVTIAVFLAAVCAPLILRNPAPNVPGTSHVPTSAGNGRPETS